MTRGAKTILRLLRSSRHWFDGVWCIVTYVPDWIEIRRTRAGRHQAAMGSWSWYAVDRDGREVCGSQWTIGQLARAATVEAYYAPGSSVPELLPGKPKEAFQQALVGLNKETERT